MARVLIVQVTISRESGTNLEAGFGVRHIFKRSSKLARTGLFGTIIFQPLVTGRIDGFYYERSP